MGGEVVTMVSCWKLVRKDGVEKGFTDHVENLTVSGLVYEAESGYTPSNLESNANLAVDNLDIVGGVDSAGITASDIEARKYDDADVYLFMVNYKNPDAGNLKLARGKLGNITLHDNTYIAELRSMTQQLQQTVGVNYSPRCRANLGDSRCNAPIYPDTWSATREYAIGAYVSAPSSPGPYIFRATYTSTYASSAYSSSGEPSWNLGIGSATVDGTVVWITEHAYNRTVAVTSVESARIFHASALISVLSQLALSSAVASGYYDGGLVTWQVSAVNSTYAMEVKAYASGRIELHEPMPYVMQVGDVFQIYPGCKKRLTEDCVGEFDNAVNFRGEPFVPGTDQISKIGGVA